MNRLELILKMYDPSQAIPNMLHNHRELTLRCSNDIENNLSNIKIKHLKTDISLNIDWSSLSAHYQNCCKDLLLSEIATEARDNLFEKAGINTETMEDSQIKNFLDNNIGFIDEYIENYLSNSSLPVIKQYVKCKIVVEISDTSIDKKYAYHIIENYIYHLFLIINLSYPGFFSFYECQLICDKIDSSGKIILDSCDFGTAFQNSYKLNWPVIKTIPLKETYEWFNKINIGIKQISTNSIEKVLFAILNSCINCSKGVVSPDKTIWLSHALEALYDAPTNSIQKCLENRIFLVLGTPMTHIKSIKSNIREFYNLRSRFVHGDFNICIPNYGENLDKNVDEYYNKLMSSNVFAVGILCATLQKMIKKNWTSLTFSEIVKGG